VGQHLAGSEGRLISAVASRLRFRSQAAAPRRRTRHLLALPTGIVTLTCFVVPLGLILVYSFGSENLVDFNVDSGMGERSVAGAPGLPAGADVVVVVRPEELELAPAQGGEDAIVAEVIDVAFQGAQRTRPPALGGARRSRGGDVRRRARARTRSPGRPGLPRRARVGGAGRVLASRLALDSRRAAA